MKLTTIAQPYVNAIFEIAQKNNSYTDWKDILEVGTFIANNVIIRTFIASPNSTKVKKVKTITIIFTLVLGRALNKQEKAFIDLLLENSRINALPSILELFDTMSNLSSNVKVCHLISAYKLSKKEEDKIVKDLSDKYNTTVSIDTEINENLVGGVVIKEGDKVIDLSIKARINELGSHLQLSVTH